jgi:uncharacterized spore protein YtfJ
MNPDEVLGAARDALTVRRVFGDPIERDGAIVIPVARVRGGGGGGGGRGEAEQHGATGWGGGFGLDARPVGVYVIREGQVSWQPAIDVTRIALQGQIVAIAALLVIRTLVRRLSR